MKDVLTILLQSDLPCRLEYFACAAFDQNMLHSAGAGCLCTHALPISELALRIRHRPNYLHALMSVRVH
jgi:hypothetical protein